YGQQLTNDDQNRNNDNRRRLIVIQVLEKTSEVMLENELIDNGPAIPGEHWAIPNACDRNRQWQSPNETPGEPRGRRFASNDEIDRDYSEDNYVADQSFSQQRKAGEEVEREQ